MRKFYKLIAILCAFILSVPLTLTGCAEEYDLTLKTDNTYFVGDIIKPEALYNNGKSAFDKEIEWSVNYDDCVIIDQTKGTIHVIKLPQDVATGAENKLEITATHNRKTSATVTVNLKYRYGNYSISAKNNLTELTVGEPISGYDLFKQITHATEITMPLTLSSSDPELIEINGSSITAKKIGSSTITATTVYKGETFTATANVNSDVALIFDTDVSSVIIDDMTTKKITVNSVKLKHNGDPVDISSLNFNINNPDVATVESNGTISAVSQGITYVTPVITYSGKEYYGEAINVSVYDKNTALSDLSQEIKKANSSYIDWNGRIRFSKEVTNTFYHTATGFTVTFVGTELNLSILSVGSDESTPRIRVYVDGVDTAQYVASTASTVCENLEYGLHTVRVLKINSSWTTGKLSGLSLNYVNSDGVFLPTENRELKFEFFGDSITAGYGMGTVDYPSQTTDNYYTEDGTLTWAQFTADYFNAESSILASSGWTVAYDQSSWKSMVPRFFEGYYLTTDITTQLPSQNELNHYDVSEDIPDVVFINLCTNDLNNSILTNSFNGDITARNTSFKTGYKAFLSTLRAAYPNTKIVCVSGLMADSGEALINEIVKEFGGEANGVYAVRLPASKSGLGSHPDLIGMKKGSEVLCKYLIDKGIVTLS